MHISSLTATTQSVLLCFRWAGAMRGAVSVALVYLYYDPDGTSDDVSKSSLISATLTVVAVLHVGLWRHHQAHAGLPTRCPEGAGIWHSSMHIHHGSQALSRGAACAHLHRNRSCKR